MSNTLEPLQNWLGTEWVFRNTAAWVAATLFTWSQYEPPQQGLVYYGGASSAVVNGQQGLSVTAALQVASGVPTYFFKTEMYGEADGTVQFVSPSLTSPDFMSGISTQADIQEPSHSSDNGQFVEINFIMTFGAGLSGGGLENCQLLLQQSALLQVLPKHGQPIFPVR
jgi:hypothetical protein